MFASKSSPERRQDSGGEPSPNESKDTSKSKDTSGSYSTICLTIFVFRGQPDVYHNRHVIMYFTSPEDSKFHESVHVQRHDEDSPWVVEQIHEKADWFLITNYLSHVNAGTMQVWRGEEMTPVNIVAATAVEGRENDSGWNCQNFVFEGIEEIVNHGLQTQEWFEYVAGELTDRLFDGATA